LLDFKENEVENLIANDLKIKKDDDEIGILTNSLRYYPRKKLAKDENDLFKEVKENLKRYQK